jgi:glutathione S-transferase
VIAEYLDNRTPLAHLIPKDNTAKSAVRRWEALADGVCDAAVAVIMEQRKPEQKQDDAFVIRQLDKVTRGLTVLNNDLGHNKWCVDDTFSLADIAVGCMLGYINLRFSSTINLAADYPNLERLQSVLIKRQSFIDSMPVAN